MSGLQRLALTAISVVAALAVVVPRVTAADHDRDFALVEQAVVEGMAAHGVPGVGIAIIDAHKVVWSREFGVAEPGRKVGPDTLFQAASLSKPVAALVAAEAAESGLIDLEADALALTERWSHPAPWWDGPITLRMLLAHRGGVRQHIGQTQCQCRAMSPQWGQQGRGMHFMECFLQ